MRTQQLHGATDDGVLVRPDASAPRHVADPYAVARRAAAYVWAAETLRAAGATRVVDVGCGDGWGTAVLAGCGLAPLGIASSSDAADRARTTWPGREFRHAPLPDTREPQHLYDGLVAVGLLERLADPRRLVTEAARVLRPGGTAVFVTANRITSSPGRTRPIRGDHVWEHTAGELHRVVRARFGDARVLGLRHGRRLAAVERLIGEPLPVVLHRLHPADRTLWLRAALQRLGPRSFHVAAGDARRAVDLVAVGTA